MEMHGEGNGRQRRRGVLLALALLFAAAAILAVLAARSASSARLAAKLAADVEEPTVPVAVRAERLVAEGVGQAYPGAVVAVGAGAALEHVAAFGRIGWRDASPPVSADGTIYDLASLTKALATTTAVLLLVQDGRIALDDPVRRHLPGFEGRWKDDVTWRHLLTHTSGLPVGAAVRGATSQERLRRLLRTQLQVPPGRLVAYSDIGYIVLWAAAERAAGEPLPELLARRVWRPLGMHATSFAPGRDCEACAPTLRLRDGEPFRGISNDRIARELGGYAGHAGLFATAPDVARFAAMIANGGELDGERILDEALVTEMLRQQPGAGRRTLGWNAFCPDEPPVATTPCTQPVAYGQTGWTGTSLWLEPGGRWVVLLSNRSYERSERPFPLEPLRRDLFALVTGRELDVPPTRWLASAPPPDTSAVEPAATPQAAPRGAASAR